MKYESYDDLINQMVQCERCPLCVGRTQVVPGIGPLGAKLMIIGESPGFHESQQGIPFCGASGRLLNKILDTVDVKREDCFISNTVKCRPPNNRTPEPDEIQSCKRWLQYEIQFVRPLVIAAMGGTAAKLLLRGDNNFRISHEVGKAHRVNYLGEAGIVVPCYHPSYLLRSGKGPTEETVRIFGKIKTYIDRSSE